MKVIFNSWGGIRTGNSLLKTGNPGNRQRWFLKIK